MKNSIQAGNVGPYADWTDFWVPSEFAVRQYMDVPLTPVLLERVQQDLGYKLPAAYVEMARHQAADELAQLRIRTGGGQRGAADVVVELEGGMSVVLVLSVLLPAGRLELTFTDRFEFASSLLRLINTKKVTRRIAPIIPSGINIQLGTPLSRRTWATTGVASTTGRADKGRPQFGHATAAAETSCPHSGQ